MMILDNGTKVKYLHEGQWKTGVVHGVQTHEDELGIIRKLIYLIDTGNHERLDIRHIDKRNVEIDKRVNALIKRKGYGPQETYKALSEVLGQSDLPKSEIVEVVARQPEQVAVDKDLVKLA